jgi:Ca2+-transporting ATPase
MGLATLWLFHHYLPDENGLALIKAQTMAFTGLIIFEKINVFNFRSLRAPISDIGFFSNKWLIIAWLATVGLQVCAVYLPFLQRSLHTTALNLNDWLLIFAIGLPVFVSLELFKIIKWRKLKTVET